MGWAGEGSTRRMRAAQVGSLLATYVIETVGTQEYDHDNARFLARFKETYGDAAADDVAAHLPSS